MNCFLLHKVAVIYCGHTVMHLTKCGQHSQAGLIAVVLWQTSKDNDESSVRWGQMLAMQIMNHIGCFDCTKRVTLLCWGTISGEISLVTCSCLCSFLAFKPQIFYAVLWVESVASVLTGAINFGYDSKCEACGACYLARPRGFIGDKLVD